MEYREEKVRSESEEYGECWEGVLIVNETELHDLLATWYHLGQENPIQKVRIVPNSRKFTPQMIMRWEAQVAAALKMLHRLDAQFHEDAEFVCMEAWKGMFE